MYKVGIAAIATLVVVAPISYYLGYMSSRSPEKTQLPGVVAEVIIPSPSPSPTPGFLWPTVKASSCQQKDILNAIEDLMRREERRRNEEILYFAEQAWVSEVTDPTIPEIIDVIVDSGGPTPSIAKIVFQKSSCTAGWIQSYIGLRNARRIRD